MKRLFALIAVSGMLFFMASNAVVAQDEAAAQDTTAAERSQQVEMAADVQEEAAAAAEEGQSLHSELKQNFIEGNPTFMSFVLITLF